MFTEASEALKAKSSFLKINLLAFDTRSSPFACADTVMRIPYYEDEFDNLEKATETLFNALTRMFYIKHEIDSDPNKYRVKMFRMAMVVQID